MTLAEGTAADASGGGAQDRSDLAEVTIRAVAAGGSGVGDLPDGRAVFIARTVPGDRARIRVRKRRARWATGTLETLLEPGPGRVEAPCPRYDECGGCQLQHLAYEEQLRWKGRFVADALTRIGHFTSIEPPEVVASPVTYAYRNRVTYSLRRLRGGRVVAGFHALERSPRIVEVRDECLLPSAVLNRAWTELRGSWGAGASLLPDAGALRLTLREVGEGVELIVRGGRAGWEGEALLARAPNLRAVWHVGGGEDASAALAAGSPAVGGGTSFEQVNAAAAEPLRDHVLEACRSRVGRGATVVDAYCGRGVYGRALALSGCSVVGIESDPVSAAAAEAEAPEGFRVVRAEVEAALASELPANLLLVNPPRSGLGADLPRTIREAAPGSLVYASCDPATLARDLAGLADRFELVGLRAFDLFPQTAHVEAVATLTIREGSA